MPHEPRRIRARLRTTAAVVETAKAMGVLLIFWPLRREFDNMRDGIVYGALVPRDLRDAVREQRPRKDACCNPGTGSELPYPRRRSSNANSLWWPVRPD